MGVVFPQDVLWPTTVGKFFSSTFGENRDDHFHMGLDIKTNGKIGLEVLEVEDGYISRIHDLIIVVTEKHYTSVRIQDMRWSMDI